MTPGRSGLLQAQGEGGAAADGALGVGVEAGREGGVCDQGVAVRVQAYGLGEQPRAQAVALAQRPVHGQPAPGGSRVRGPGARTVGRARRFRCWKREYAGGLPAASAAQYVRGEIVGEGGQCGEYESGGAVRVFARATPVHGLRGAPYGFQCLLAAAREDVRQRFGHRRQAQAAGPALAR